MGQNHTLNSRGARINTNVDFPQTRYRGTAVLMHGFSSSLGNKTNAGLVPRLVDKGILVLRFDFQGHGKSDGSISDLTVSRGVEDVDAAVAFLFSHVADADGLPVVFFGSSYGGAVALAAGVKHKVAGVVLKAPALDIPAMFLAEKGEAGMAEWEKRGYCMLASSRGEIRLNYTYVSDAINHSLYDDASRSNIPIAIVHGSSDEVVPVEQSRTLQRLVASRCKLLEFAGCDHRFSNSACFDAMLDACEEQIMQQIYAGPAV